MDKKSVVRVATTNNFNCTTQEWKQLQAFTEMHPDKYFFINTNIHTPKLSTIAKHKFKAVVTLNPNLNFPKSGINPLLTKLEKIKDNIAFIRIKYLPQNQPILDAIKMIFKLNYPVVITNQRFNGKASLQEYTKLEYYKFSCSRFRLDGIEKQKLLDLIHGAYAKGKQAYICDESGKGCKDCGLCSSLTLGIKTEIAALNLSTSGVCPYSCPDCYAKTMQNFATKMGNKPIVFDTIKQNDKQAGRTVHIKSSQ